MLDNVLVMRVIELEKELAQSKAENECLKSKHLMWTTGVRRIQEEVYNQFHAPNVSCNIIGGICKGLIGN